ncbi:unnamed protein product, partial [Phaeothamnion confervicola]
QFLGAVSQPHPAPIRLEPSSTCCATRLTCPRLEFPKVYCLPYGIQPPVSNCWPITNCRTNCNCPGCGNLGDGSPTSRTVAGRSGTEGASPVSPPGAAVMDLREKASAALVTDATAPAAAGSGGEEVEPAGSCAEGGGIDGTVGSSYVAGQL